MHFNDATSKLLNVTKSKNEIYSTVRVAKQKMTNDQSTGFKMRICFYACHNDQPAT